MAEPVRILLPGAGGFFGRWILEALEGAGHQVTALTRDELDLTDGGAVARTVEAVSPQVIVNAAGISTPRACREDPDGCFQANTTAVFNLLEAVRTRAPGCRPVLLSSAAVYGPGAGEPLAEDEPAAPHSVYGASKVAAEILAGQYIREGRLKATTLRVFNLIGPGQPAGQAAAEFSREVRAAADRGLEEATITVGDPGIRRDFTDVRDAARAVTAVAERPDTADRILNLCSGRPVSLRQMADALGAIVEHRTGSPFKVHLETDEGRLRPGDPLVLCGIPDRLAAATGWRPRVTLEESLAGLLGR